MDELISLKMFNEKVRIDCKSFNPKLASVGCGPGWCVPTAIPRDKHSFSIRTDRFTTRQVFDMFFYDEVIHNLCMCLYR